MLREGLFTALFDVQSFDAAVTTSMADNPYHMEVDVSCYANPFNKGCLVNDLDVVVLAALDVDADFNVDVLTGHDGILQGASGGHSDTAAGAKLSVITIPSMRNGVPSIRERVQTVVTPRRPWTPSSPSGVSQSIPGGGPPVRRPGRRPSGEGYPAAQGGDRENHGDPRRGEVLRRDRGARGIPGRHHHRHHPEGSVSPLKQTGPPSTGAGPLLSAIRCDNRPWIQRRRGRYRCPPPVNL